MLHKLDLFILNTTQKVFEISGVKVEPCKENCRRLKGQIDCQNKTAYWQDKTNVEFQTDSYEQRYPIKQRSLERFSGNRRDLGNDLLRVEGTFMAGRLTEY